MCDNIFKAVHCDVKMLYCLFIEYLIFVYTHDFVYPAGSRII